MRGKTCQPQIKNLEFHSTPDELIKSCMVDHTVFALLAFFHVCVSHCWWMHSALSPAATECVCTQPVSLIHPELAGTSLDKQQTCDPKSIFSPSGCFCCTKYLKNKANWDCFHVKFLLFPCAFIAVGQVSRYAAKIVHFRISATKEVEMYHLSLLHSMHKVRNNKYRSLFLLRCPLRKKYF